MLFRLLLISLIYLSFLTNLKANQDIIVTYIYPPKCTMLKDSKVLLCPRIMEVDVEIKYNNSNNNKKLINCILLSEEGEILAYGENFIIPPKGRIYLTIKQNRRKIHEMKLIASSKCEYSK
jgi:hypothetical protein